MLKIAIILGSTRPGRNGEAVAKWVYEIAQKRNEAKELSSISPRWWPIMGRLAWPSTARAKLPSSY